MEKKERLNTSSIFLTFLLIFLVIKRKFIKNHAQKDKIGS